MNEMDIRQLKLTSGEEIICEIISWKDESEEADDDDLVIKNALLVDYIPTHAAGTMCALKPWILGQVEDIDNFQILNFSHVMNQAVPVEAVRNQFFKTIYTIQSKTDFVPPTDEEQANFPAQTHATTLTLQ